MKKSLLSALLIGANFSLFAQVGIGTNSPQATLDIVGEPSNTSKLDAVIPPRITGDQLNAKLYTTKQDGAIVYVTTESSIANQNGQTINVNMPGLYYFDKISMTWIFMGSNPVMTNFRSTLYQALNLTDYTDQTITFTSTESLINLATTFDDDSDEFTIKYDGIYQLSAFVGFNANQPNFTDARDFVAVNLKISKANAGSTTFNSVTGIRSVFAGITAGIGTAIQVPTTILPLKAGDKIKFIIQRPNLLIGTSPNHKSNSPLGDFGTNNGHINLPSGQNYTKSLTILKVK